MVRIGPVKAGEFPLLLAPMEDVSDPPFRRLCKQQGADVVYTEFISSEGLIRQAAKSTQKLDIYGEERPVGIQIFGAEREPMRESARIVEQVQPDILDINFGCPVKKVTCKGAGAAILRDVDKMAELTREIVQSTSLPVTVKTRLGWNTSTIRIVEVALRLQEAGIKALSIHGRTREQMYKGEADWSFIQQVKQHPDIEIPIFGNGDIDTPEKALAYRNRYGVDGIMIGRASIGYPWIFREIKHYLATGAKLPPPTMVERVQVCREHLEFSLAWKGERTGVYEMRRHYANYFRGLPNFKPYRTALVTQQDPQAIFDLLETIAQNYRPDEQPAYLAPEAA